MLYIPSESNKLPEERSLCVGQKAVCMPVLRPYRRTVRPFLQGGYFNAPYVFHAKFAEHGPQYIRAFMLLQKDVLELFDYVEPADENLSTYSYRIHELHMRLCIEVEANCRAILSENRYVNPKGEAEWWTIVDYRKLNPTHRLASYEVRTPFWHGNENTRVPFSSWATELRAKHLRYATKKLMFKRGEESVVQ